MAANILSGSAFISGAASGIGKATALAFIKYGVVKLAIADVNQDALDALAAEISAASPAVEVLPLLMDVRSTDDVKAGFAKIAAAFGRLDIAVNAAGVAGKPLATHEQDDEEWARVVDTNLTGLMRCQREELALMRNQENLGVRIGRGSIINVSSIWGIGGTRGQIFQGAYSATKHAVAGLTRSDTNDYASLGIRINAISPGYIGTPMLKAALDRNPDGVVSKLIQSSPLQRMGMPEEVADSIVFLASSMSSFVMGATLVCDGGTTCH